MKGRSAVAVILILPVTACASLGVKTSGISGPVAWQAVEMNVSGNAVLGQNSSWYSFVLALKETSGDRKSTRLNSSHSQISYAVFCLKKKKNNLVDKLPRTCIAA